MKPEYRSTYKQRKNREGTRTATGTSHLQPRGHQALDLSTVEDAEEPRRQEHPPRKQRSFFLIVYLLLLHSKTQKDQKYFCCFSSFVSLSFSISLLSFKIRFVIQKFKNILLYCLFLFALVSKTRKPKNICCFFLVSYSVFRVGQPSVTPMELGFHSYHSKQHK